MSKTPEQVLAANTEYVAGFGDQGKLPMPPSRHFAILTCMDARLDPAKYAGLAEGDAHVIRNAGGPAMTRSAPWSSLTSFWVPGSGLSFTTPPAAWKLSPIRSCGSCWRAVWRPQRLTRTAGMTPARGPVRRIRSHPLVPAGIPIYGYIYDCKTGRLQEVPEATRVGRAT